MRHSARRRSGQRDPFWTWRVCRNANSLEYYLLKVSNPYADAIFRYGLFHVVVRHRLPVQH
jgi:hypothetical protein